MKIVIVYKIQHSSTQVGHNIIITVMNVDHSERLS